MSCQPIFFQISPSQYDALVKKASDAGIAITGNSGSASHSGVTIGWTYNPDSQQLVLQATSKPFYVSCDYLEKKLTELVNGAST